MDSEDRSSFESMTELLESPDQEARDVGAQIFLGLVEEDLSNFTKDWCFKIWVEKIKETYVDVQTVKAINQKFLECLKNKELRKLLENLTTNNIR